MKTKRIVITGGPATGKTSVINELLKRDLICLEEISRQVTLDARAKGIEQLFLSNPLLFSELLLQGRVKQFQEANTLNSSVLYYDRGIPDVIAYLNYVNQDYPESFDNACKTHIYNTVFILAPWLDIFKSDNERYETFNQAQDIHNHLLKTYQNFGYNLIDVPFDTVKNRTDFILNHVINR